MDIEKKKEELSRYLIAVRRLEIKCSELNKWRELGDARGGFIDATSKPKNFRSAGSIYGTALNIESEVETLAEQVTILRTELNTALEAMPTLFLRDLLEGRYVSGDSIKSLSHLHSYSVRHIRRQIFRAIEELENCSTFFEI